MYNIHVEIPSGGISRGIDRQTEEEANRVFDHHVSQIKSWKSYVADVVLTADGVETRREHIDAA